MRSLKNIQLTDTELSYIIIYSVLVFDHLSLLSEFVVSVNKMIKSLLLILCMMDDAVVISQGI